MSSLDDWQTLLYSHALGKSKLLCLVYDSLDSCNVSGSSPCVDVLATLLMSLCPEEVDPKLEVETSANFTVDFNVPPGTGDGGSHVCFECNLVTIVTQTLYPSFRKINPIFFRYITNPVKYLQSMSLYYPEWSTILLFPHRVCMQLVFRKRIHCIW